MADENIKRKMTEEDIRNQINLFKNVISNIPHAIFWKDLNSVYFGCNENFAKIAGLKKPEDIFGKSDRDLPWKKGESDAFIADDRRVMDSGVPMLNIEEPQLQANGKEAVILTSKVPLKDSSGKVIGLLGIYSDITERKNMEVMLRKDHAALIETANQWQVTFDSSSDMIMLLDADMRIVKANRACLEYLQMPISEIVGRLCYYIFHTGGKPIENCPVTRMSKEMTGRASETIYVPEKNMWISITVDIIQDKSGKITGYVHTMRDVTAQKNLEDEIRKSEVKFRTVFENSSGAIIIFDITTGQVVECNSGAEKLIKRMRVQMIGMRYMDIHPKEEAEEYARIIDQHLAKGYSGDYEGEVEHEDGSRVPVLMRAQKMKMDDKDVAMVLLIDIADRKRDEVSIKKAYDELKMIQADLIQSEKMAAIGRFSAGIAHEVKNPLAVIVGCAELLQNKMPRYDLDAMDTLEKIKDAALRANSILVSLLQFARPSDLKVEIADPQELIEGVLPLFEKRANEANIAIVKNFSAIKMRLSVDKNQIHQVIFNIIKNAIEAMPGGGRLTIKTHKMVVSELSYSQPSCVIELQDTGSGISKENMMKIAEPFFSTKERVAGTGLGLFMVKSILDKHRGKLLVASDVQRGTSIKIVLPIIKDEVR